MRCLRISTSRCGASHWAVMRTASSSPDCVALARPYCCASSNASPWRTDGAPGRWEAGGTDAAFVEDVGMAMRGGAPRALRERVHGAEGTQSARGVPLVPGDLAATGGRPRCRRASTPLRDGPTRGLLARDLRALFSEVGALARERGAGVLLTVDEVQFLKPEHLEALLVALHRMAQDRLPLLVAAAGLPSVPGRLGRRQVLRGSALRLPHHQQPQSGGRGGGGGDTGRVRRGRLAGRRARTDAEPHAPGIRTSCRSSRGRRGTLLRRRTRLRWLT